jgi:acetoin utilization protein AcuB
MKDNAEPSRPDSGGALVAEGKNHKRQLNVSLGSRAREAVAHHADIADLQVGEFMTLAPHTIGDDQSLTDGHRLLHELEVRHLPVLHGGKLVGLLSQRDLDFLLGSLGNVDPEHTPVSEAMSSDTYAVGPHETLRHVAAEMAGHHYNTAVVVDHGRVIGIFTTADALGALSTLLASPVPVAV